jgi:hypothetical protein
MDAVLNACGEAPLQVSGVGLVPLLAPGTLHAKPLSAEPELLALTISAPVGIEAAPESGPRTKDRLGTTKAR